MAGVCIVFPVEFDGSVPDSHVTNIWLGEIEDAGFNRKDIEKVVEKLRTEWYENYPTGLSVVSSQYDHFGRDEDILVFLPSFHPFNYFREMVEFELRALGVVSASEFDYRAHVTAPRDWDLKAQGIPALIKVGAPVLWWGKDRPANNVTGAKVVNVKSEHLVETHHFSRHIKLLKGPMMVTKKNIMGVRTPFRAKELRINWRNGDEPKEVIVYGKTRGFPKTSARRHYKLAKAPQWIKDLL